MLELTHLQFFLWGDSNETKSFSIFAFLFYAEQFKSLFYFYKPHTKAKQAIIIDMKSGSVLFSQKHDERMTPSSLSKLATVSFALEALNSGVLKRDQKFTVSKKARYRGGSRMFLELGAHVTLDDLLKGIIVSSGNDAATTLAEGLAGKEESFARMMTNHAKKLGAKNTNFVNACGWPNKNHYSTAYDLALIAKDIIERFPELYKEYFTLKEFTYNKITQYNRNKLLWRKNDGFYVDGMKTGHTEKGGYGLVFSAVKTGENPTRLIGVINGLSSENGRIREANALLRWAFNQHKTAKLMEKGKSYFDIPIVNGVKKLSMLLAQKTSITQPM